MTRVKICGFKHMEDALVAVEAGADLVGFIFAPSRRRIDPDVAREIIAAVHARSAARAVGVFVNADRMEINAMARICGLDYVQLSGDELDDLPAALDAPSIQAIHIGPATTAELVAKRAETSQAEILLLDTAQDGAYGGTGESFDWSRVPLVDRPVLLAGGLHARNVGRAIKRVRPWGVDVSSGVETNGEKDQAKIRAFVKAVHSS